MHNQFKATFPKNTLQQFIAVSVFVSLIYYYKNQAHAVVQLFFLCCSGDEILEIHGVPVMNKAVPEVVEIIKQCPTEFLATVRPITSVHKRAPNPSRVDYSSIVHRQPLPLPNNNKYNNPPSKNGIKNNHFYEIDSNDSTTSSDESVEYATVVKKHNERQLEVHIHMYTYVHVH